MTERLVDVERTGRTKSKWGTTGLDSSTGDLNKHRVSATAEVVVGGNAEARYWYAELTVEAAGNRAFQIDRQTLSIYFVSMGQARKPMDQWSFEFWTHLSCLGDPAEMLAQS